MNISERDRKIALAIMPILLLVGYWFLLLAPKRDAAAKASKDAPKQTQRRDKARPPPTRRAGQDHFAADYAEIVRLGKAIPSGVDMPSLVVQLDRAAAGTDIRFTKLARVERDPAAPASPHRRRTRADRRGHRGAAPVEAGGATAQSAPGGAVESANNTAADRLATRRRRRAVGRGRHDVHLDRKRAAGRRRRRRPRHGGRATSSGRLETVPLDLEFVGNFFNLADFFHDVKRFVRVANRTWS